MHMITICRADELLEILQTDNYEAVLSIEHPGSTLGRGAAPRLQDTEQQIISFWDVEDESAHQGPSEDVVKTAMNFLDNHRGENMIIHCHAGKSRSVAIALGWIAKEMTNDLAQDEAIDHAIDYIKSIRPIAAPNMAVIDIIDRLYEFDGQLSGAVAQDPVFSENIRIANERRAEIAASRPDLLEQMYPEKTADGRTPANKLKPQ